MDTKLKYSIIYLCIEVVILITHLILIELSVDLLFYFFQYSIIAFMAVGLFWLMYLSFVRKSMRSKDFNYSFGLTIIGLFLPVLLVFYILSRLH
jgi:hypothetical protein